MHSRDHVSPDPAVEDSFVNLAPADQPRTVHELAERLLGAYVVDGGTVHLAGCLLENRLFLRLAARRGDQSVEFFLDHQGNDVSPAMVRTLGMANTTTLPRAPEEAGEAMRFLAEVGRRKLAERWLGPDPPAEVDLAAVWCAFAQGKLRFTIEPHAVDLPFADWVRALEPPPFICPHTNRPTYHVTALDDGRIVAAEETATCEQSGQRVLAQELVSCETTGRRVLPEFTATCPATGATVLRSTMVCCDVCRQKMAPAAVQGGRCEACRHGERVSKSDPRLARILDEHPLLDRWRRWRLSEAAASYHLTAHSWFRRLLVIVDKDSLGIKLLATGHRLRTTWDVVEPDQYDLVLRG